MSRVSASVPASTESRAPRRAVERQGPMRVLHLLDQASQLCTPATLRLMQAASQGVRGQRHHALLLGGSPAAGYAQVVGMRNCHVVGVTGGQAAQGMTAIRRHLARLPAVDVIQTWSLGTATVAAKHLAPLPVVLTVCQQLSPSDLLALQAARKRWPKIHMLLSDAASCEALQASEDAAGSIEFAHPPIWPGPADQVKPSPSDLHARWGGRSDNTRVGMLLCDTLPGPNASDAVLAVAMAEHILDPDGIALKVLVHPDQTGRQRAERAAAELGHNHRLVCEPATLTPWLLAQGCDFALAAGAFGNELSIASAMANGLPVIAEPRPALAYLLEHEVTALIVEAGNPRAMAHAIQRVLRDPALGHRLGEAARNRVAATCSIADYQVKLARSYVKAEAVTRSPQLAH